MAQIGIADKTTLDTVNTKVGTNGDASGTSTLFARLQKISDYVDTLETNLATVNSNINTIKGYTDTLETSISALLPKIPQSASITIASQAITIGAWYTLVNVTSGKGILNRVSMSQVFVDNSNYQIRITIDGTQYLIKSPTDVGGDAYIMGNNSYRLDILPNVHFSSSLKVEISSMLKDRDLEGVADYSLV